VRRNIAPTAPAANYRINANRNLNPDPNSNFDPNPITLCLTLILALTFVLASNFPLMLFSVRGGRKSKQTWGYFPSATDGKRRACGRYFPTVWTEIYVLKAIAVFVVCLL